MLEDDKKRIDDLTSRSRTVWSVIKEIAVNKYPLYLDQLEVVSNTETQKSELAQIKGRWEETSHDRGEFISSEQFDEDLSNVLKWVAQRVYGLSSSEYNLQASINQWRKKSGTFEMKRDVALKIAVGLGFSIDETRKLIFSTLSDDEQLDFDPRLPNEMIYFYAIKNSIPYASKEKKNKKDKEAECVQVTVKGMMEAAERGFLVNLFGQEHAENYDKLIKLCEDKLNLLDSSNMMKSALLLGVINSSRDDSTIIERIDKLFETENKNVTVLEKLSSESVTACCYEYVLDRIKENPTFRLVEYSRAEYTRYGYLSVFRLILEFLETSIGNTESLERQELYSSMRDFIQSSLDFVTSHLEKDRFSPIDFLYCLDGSNLRDYTVSDISSVIDNHIIGRMSDELTAENITEYHITSNSRVNIVQFRYFDFFFKAIKTAIKVQQILKKYNCEDLWQAYVEMNKILIYPYFDENGIVSRLIAYEDEKAELKLNNPDPKFPIYTYTMEVLLHNEELAYDVAPPEHFIEEVLSCLHCYEYYDSTFLSRSKENFIRPILKECNLFCKKEGVWISHFPEYYDYEYYRSQFKDRSIPIKRKDVLKAAFLSWVSNQENLKDDLELREDDFITYFDDEVAPSTCCAPINYNNSLDALLLLSLVSSNDPMQFLKEAVSYNKKIAKIF